MNILAQLRSRILAHLFQILTATTRTHGSGIILIEHLVALLQLDARMLARNDDRAAGLARSELGTLECAVRGR